MHRPRLPLADTFLGWRGKSVDVKREFTLVIEKDEAGWFVATVPELPGCATQARSREALKDRAREAILLYIETNGFPSTGPEFVGVDKVEVVA